MLFLMCHEKAVLTTVKKTLVSDSEFQTRLPAQVGFCSSRERKPASHFPFRLVWKFPRPSSSLPPLCRMPPPPPTSLFSCFRFISQLSSLKSPLIKVFVPHTGTGDEPLLKW